ncbi:hypothetical protein RI367_004532 [Sorochytrium milnesiophthora]
MASSPRVGVATSSSSSSAIKLDRSYSSKISVPRPLDARALIKLQLADDYVTAYDRFVASGGTVSLQHLGDGYVLLVGPRKKSLAVMGSFLSQRLNDMLNAIDSGDACRPQSPAAMDVHSPQLSSRGGGAIVFPSPPLSETSSATSSSEDARSSTGASSSSHRSAGSNTAMPTTPAAPKSKRTSMLSLPDAAAPLRTATPPPGSLSPALQQQQRGSSAGQPQQPPRHRPRTPVNAPGSPSPAMPPSALRKPRPVTMYSTASAPEPTSADNTTLPPPTIAASEHGRAAGSGVRPRSVMFDLPAICEWNEDPPSSAVQNWQQQQQQQQQQQAMQYMLYVPYGQAFAYDVTQRRPSHQHMYDRPRSPLAYNAGAAVHAMQQPMYFGVPQMQYLPQQQQQQQQQYTPYPPTSLASQSSTYLPNMPRMSPSGNGRVVYDAPHVQGRRASDSGIIGRPQSPLASAVQGQAGQYSPRPNAQGGVPRLQMSLVDRPPPRVTGSPVSSMHSPTSPRFSTPPLRHSLSNSSISSDPPNEQDEVPLGHRLRRPQPNSDRRGSAGSNTRRPSLASDVALRPQTPSPLQFTATGERASVKTKKENRRSARKSSPSPAAAVGESPSKPRKRSLKKTSQKGMLRKTPSLKRMAAAAAATTAGVATAATESPADADLLQQTVDVSAVLLMSDMSLQQSPNSRTLPATGAAGKRPLSYADHSPRLPAQTQQPRQRPKSTSGYTGNTRHSLIWMMTQPSGNSSRSASEYSASTSDDDDDDSSSSSSNSSSDDSSEDSLPLQRPVTPRPQSGTLPAAQQQQHSNGSSPTLVAQTSPVPSSAAPSPVLASTAASTAAAPGSVKSTAKSEKRTSLLWFKRPLRSASMPLPEESDDATLVSPGSPSASSLPPMSPLLSSPVLSDTITSPPASPALPPAAGAAKSKRASQTSMFSKLKANFGKLRGKA